jgi:hypothetical protein
LHRSWLLLFRPEEGGGGSAGDSGAGGDGGGSGGDGGGGSEGGGAPPEPQKPQASAGGDGGSTDSEPDAAAAESKQLQEQLAAAEKRAKEAEARAKELEKKDLDAQQKAEQERDEEKQRAAELATANRALRVQVAAANIGIRPEAAIAAEALIDWNSVDADNDVAVERALKGLKEKHGYLFKDVEAARRGADGGAGRGDSRPEDEPSPGMGRLRQAYDTAKT